MGSGVGPLLWMAAITFGLFIGGYLLWAQQSRRGTLEAEYSTYRTDDRGARALFLTLETLGMRPARWTADFSRLPARGMLVILDPATPASLLGNETILPFEVKALDEWVRRGNTVVIMSNQPNRLFQALGVFASVARGRGATEPSQPTLLARGVPKLTLQSVRAFRFGTEPNGQGILGDSDDSARRPIKPPAASQWLTLFGTRADPVAIATTRGHGEYILVADPYPASNLGLAQPGNLPFMVNLASQAPGGTILFDEAHHREIQRGFVAYSRAKGLLPLLMYALALVAMVIWRGSVPFGRPDPLVTSRHRDSGEYVRAVAALYRNAGMGRDGLATTYAAFRRASAVRFRLGSGWDADRIAERLGNKTVSGSGEIRQLLSEVESALARPTLTESEALLLVARLASLERQEFRGECPRSGWRVNGEGVTA